MDMGEVRTWLKEHRRVLVFQEIVFFSAFLIWAIVRGANPEIIGTEKPMELAFINGIYQSPSFPPNDPWLSGYAISYYYFGYLIVAALMHLLGTAFRHGFQPGHRHDFRVDGFDFVRPTGQSTGAKST